VAAGAAQLGVKTALVEGEHMGGDCLYYGCVPSKTLLKSAEIASAAAAGGRYGVRTQQGKASGAAAIMNRIAEVIGDVEPHDSPDRFRELGTEVFLNRGRFTSPHTVALSQGGEISAPKIVIATGSSPLIPPIEGLRETGYLTNRDIFSLQKLPSSLVVLGGGAIGCEMGQAFARLGSRVTLVDMLPQVLGAEDADMAAVLEEALVRDGIELRLGSTVRAVRSESRGTRVVIDREGVEEELLGEKILVALGRRGNTDELGLDAAGVERNGSFIPVDSSLRTNVRHIYACGDVNGKYLFTHAAGAEGSFIVRKAMLHLPGTMDYTHMPRATYTAPELASVGLNAREAEERGIRYRVLRADFSDNDRACTEGVEEGGIKILIDRRDRVIGVQIAGAHAGELLGIGVLAVKERWKISRLMAPVFPYPTLAEVYREAVSDYLAPKLFNERVRGLLRMLFGYRG